MASITSTYRSLLRESRRLPHIYLRHFFRTKFQNYFRENIVTKQYRPSLVNVKLRTARKELRRLRRANDGDKRALEHILDLAYGRKGKLKHELMKRFLSNPLAPPPPRIIPTVERSRPPSYSPELATLLTSIHARHNRPLKPSALHTPPTLPKHADPNSEEARLLGPFSRRREVNIRWRYHTNELTKTYFPLEVTKCEDVNINPHPRETGAEELKLLEEVERLARSPHNGPPMPRRERCITTTTTGPSEPYEASFDSPLPMRFLRRRYRELLSRIPILIPDSKAASGCRTALSPLALSNATRQSRNKQASEQDVEWIIKAAKQEY